MYDSYSRWMMQVTERNVTGNRNTYFMCKTNWMHSKPDAAVTFFSQWRWRRRRRRNSKTITNAKFTRRLGISERIIWCVESDLSDMKIVMNRLFNVGIN